MVDDSKKDTWIDYELMCEDIPEAKHKLFKETFKEDPSHIGMVNYFTYLNHIVGTQFFDGVFCAFETSASLVRQGDLSTTRCRCELSQR
jgi:hypothetical protein